MKCGFLRRTFPGSVLVLIIASLSACSLLTDEADGDALEVHLQSSFDGERVRVKIDGILVYDAQATTNHRIGLADVIQLQRTEGRHRIEVSVDGGYRFEQGFELEDRLFVGVTFFRESIPEAGLEEGIHLELSERGFRYL